MEKIKICITGTDGFIGSNLTKTLNLNNNIILIPFDGNLLNKDDIVNFFDANKNIDQIIHLAGTFFGDFDELLKINVLTTQNLLHIAVKNGVKKIIYPSSGAIYGEPIMEESLETDILKPNTFYGLAKLYTEDCIKYYYNNFNLNYIILRLPNVYGENNNKGVIYNFLTDIKNKREITIYGDGTQSRNFLHVSDVCMAIEKSIFYDKSDIFNISNPTKVSINEIVKILAKKYEFRIIYKEANNNLKDLLLDINKARNELNFLPKVKDLQI